MAIKLYKPTTPGRRFTSVIDYAKELAPAKKKAPKSLLSGYGKSAGRNNSGRITVRHRGGGAKRKRRLVDFSRIDRLNIPAKVASIEYDPTRTAFISLVSYKDGVKRYILTPLGIKVGAEVVYSPTAEILPGNRMQIKNIPVGTTIHDVELIPEQGGKLARSAGSSITLQTVEGGYALLKLPSGEIRRVKDSCSASIGQLANTDHMNVRIGKAGRMRHMGFRPSVRGKVMNPVDHPHGGGEASNSIGMKYPKTPTGRHALGVKTRDKKKYSNRSIVRHRNSKKR